jgi:hypothetical protein
MVIVTNEEERKRTRVAQSLPIVHHRLRIEKYLRSVVEEELSNEGKQKA